MVMAVSRPRRDNIGRKNVLLVEGKKTYPSANKLLNLLRFQKKKIAAAIIEQAVIQALEGNGAPATRNKGVKTRAHKGFRANWKQFNSKNRVHQFSIINYYWLW